MNLQSLILLPFILQAAAIAVDEFYYHHKRGLGLWERLGHPLDTLTVLSVYVFCFVWTFSPSNLLIFIGLSIFSCVFVTKDEFVHNKLCSAGEQLLHSILFLVHSLTCVALGYVWSLPKSTNLFSDLPLNSIFENFTVNDFLIGQISVLSVFVIYQIIFWNFNLIKRSLWTKQI